MPSGVDFVRLTRAESRMEESTDKDALCLTGGGELLPFGWGSGETKAGGRGGGEGMDMLEKMCGSTALASRGSCGG